MRRLALCTALLLAACSRPAGHGGSPAATQVGAAAAAQETPGTRAGDCSALPDATQLRQWLKAAPDKGEAGGLAGGRFEWAAIVDRAGELCAVVASTDDPAAPWPGSRAVAAAKAYTANAFSTDQVPLSTARMYTLSQPGHSLWGLAAANPFNPACLSRPDHDAKTPQLCGGTIAFAGGLPLYRGMTRVGGLGASGDTACADHEIAKRIRDAAGLNPPAGALADDITFSSVDGASIYTHPLCPNTWRNNQKIGDEPAAAGY